MDTSEELDALFASPLEGFIAERDRLAKEIAASGDKDAARSVKSLRKPSLVAWTLNQLARRDPEGLTALFDTGTNMREALEEGDSKGAREAQAVRRSQLKRLGDAANEILRSGGHAASSGHVDKVRAVLLQASTDRDIASAISKGRLSEAPAADALPDIFESLTPVPGEADADVADDSRATRRRRQLQERIEVLRDEAEAAAQEAARLAREAESARVAADAAEDVASAAQRAADRAMRHLEEAEKELRGEARRS